MDTLVSVEAPVGTDPDALHEAAKKKFRALVLEGTFDVMFDKCFSGEDGLPEYGEPEEFLEAFNEASS
jgi:hypothetical protein